VAFHRALVASPGLGFVPMIGPECSRCHRDGIEVYKGKEGVCPWICSTCSRLQEIDSLLFNDTPIEKAASYGRHVAFLLQMLGDAGVLTARIDGKRVAHVPVNVPSSR